MFDWASSLWGGFTSAASTIYDYGKSAASYLVDNAQGVGTLLAGGAALYGATHQPDMPALPQMPALPKMDAPTVQTTAASMTAAAPLDLSANYKSILDQGAKVKDTVKLNGDTTTDLATTAATAKEDKRKKAARSDIKTDTTVWDSYAPVSFKTLLGGTS